MPNNPDFDMYTVDIGRIESIRENSVRTLIDRNELVKYKIAAQKVGVSLFENAAAGDPYYPTDFAGGIANLPLVPAGKIHISLYRVDNPDLSDFWEELKKL